MWWHGMFSLVEDLFDPKVGRKFDWLWLVVVGVIAVASLGAFRVSFRDWFLGHRGDKTTGSSSLISRSTSNQRRIKKRNPYC